ncbi:f-box protein pp2-a12-like [Gigaspora margarita]|uniref:F-box protein pp2-a12-like n=1 Tax=Gigaspora margarita TaxID=4874 RepID=A0A8H4B5Q2_GIGMA|nr:f-box protein pp2-a12-like [Gigaspora margarita]
MSSIFSEIPYEIVVKILTLLSAKDLCSVSLVEKNLLTFTQDNYVWELICINRFPASRISEEQKNMIADETISKIQQTNNSESKNDEQQVTISENSEWKRLYKRLSKYINFLANERDVVGLDDGQFPWKILETSQSEYGKVAILEIVMWFDVSLTLKSVLPGTYDVVWRLGVTKDSWDFEKINFRTTVIEKLEDEIDAEKLEDELDNETTIHNKQRYNHIPQSSTYYNIACKKKWVEYCLPYKIVVPEQKVVDGKLVYHDVRLRIYKYCERTLRYNLWVDCVRLREHNENRVYEKFEDNDSNCDYTVSDDSDYIASDDNDDDGDYGDDDYGYSYYNYNDNDICYSDDDDDDEGDD